MRRRTFLGSLAGAAAWPLVVRAQRLDGLRKIGVLSGFAETDPEAQAWDAAFRRRLDELGWIKDRNIQINYRWGAGNLDRMKLFAAELVQSSPDVLVGVSTAATAALQRQTPKIPIVFAIVSDPIGSGFVSSVSRPGGNITGFVNVESSLAGKWLGLLREIAPQISRIAFMYNPKTAPYAGYYLEIFKSLALKGAIEPREVRVSDATEIETTMAALGSQADTGLVVMPEPFTQGNRTTIISNAAHYRIPTVYPARLFVADGGLISYGMELSDTLRGAASYVDRILRGARPEDLPVQLPTKFELVINLKAAKEVGFDIPQALIARADEVIE